MSQNSVEQIIGRLVTDDTFRCHAHTDFPRACREQGFCLTEDEQSLLGRIDLDFFIPLATKLDDGLKRATMARVP